ncbi:dTDP-4-amino-4,6-dideoxygalactose transaminase [Jannaschia sp. R86511]|uniref:dTDP-4-amino-4,6-dideoxygalactose transaminase n=1 Tax=Jannaschia sp. R86511 TaxID=3093853 RepID=UPI0036D34FA8
MSDIRFSKPWSAPGELDNLTRALASGHLHGDGPFTAAASQRLRDLTGTGKALLTSSCTHALELAGLLLDLQPGDEVVVPSFTFSSTAAAVAIRGATPVFVDVDPLTLNVDPAQVAAAVTDRTRAVYVVHYGGVAVDVPAVRAAAGDDVVVVEDNAHGLGASVDGRLLGSLAPLAAQSFHDTKNVQCGEGGALLVNDERFAERAEIIREKGTNRVKFLRGQVDKYTWVDVGSSYLPSELQAALLLAQLDAFDSIQALRHRVWDGYAEALPGWAADNGVRLMHVPDGVKHPAHLFYLQMPSHEDQGGLISALKADGVTATFHYQPLHSSPAGRALGRTGAAGCPVTDRAAETLVRLPLHPGMTEADVQRVVDLVTSYRTVAAVPARAVLT